MKQVSLHFRGPLKLKQVAAYKSSRLQAHARTLQRAYRPLKHRRAHPRVVDQSDYKEEYVSGNQGREDVVTATIDGKVVTWVNDWSGTHTKLSEIPTTVPIVQNSAAATPSKKTTFQDDVLKGASQIADDVADTYTRIGYYDSVSQTVDNLVFLGNHGGQGSGVFDL